MSFSGSHPFTLLFAMSEPSVAEPAKAGQDHQKFPEKNLPDPKTLRLRRAANGSLEVYLEKPPKKDSEDGSSDESSDPQSPWVEVRVQRCFPWMTPDGFFSLRTGEGDEVAFIEEIGQLTEESARVLRDDLRVSGFTLDVKRIISLKKEIELRVWRVETEQGERQFQTELDDWPITLPDGSLLVKDVIGDLYRIANPDALDKRSKKLLWGFLH
jgi:hypothetical protein